jgi:hypothetical protein
VPTKAEDPRGPGRGGITPSPLRGSVRAPTV